MKSSPPPRVPRIPASTLPVLVALLVLGWAGESAASPNAAHGPSTDIEAKEPDMGPQRGIAAEGGGCVPPPPHDRLSPPREDEGPGRPELPRAKSDQVQDADAHAIHIKGHAEYLPSTFSLADMDSSKPRHATVPSRTVSDAPVAVLEPGDIVTVVQRAGQWTVDERTQPLVGVQGHIKAIELHRNWGSRREAVALPFGRLLARVGRGPWLDAGSGQALRTTEGGPLQLRINDRSDSLADNAGSLEVEIVVFRPPSGGTGESTH